MKVKIEDFRDLIVWQKSHQLALEIYRITKSLPDEEKFGLVSQMRRAAVSIAANIAEVFKKRSQKDKINFYNISQSSLQEIKYYLILTKDLKYVSDTKQIWELSEEIGRMLNGLVKSIDTK